MRALIVVALSLLFAPLAHASTAPLFNEAQKTEIESIIKDYLLKNPSVLTDSLQQAQLEMQKKAMEEQKAAIIANKDKLHDTKSNTVAGNPKGDVTLVEFFDYRCGYCRSSHPVIQQLLEDDKNLRIIYKEFPILGPVSLQAARYALAARNQGKYLEMREKLYDPDTPLELSALPEMAKAIGLDLDKVKADIESREIATEINDNLQLAQTLNIHGTPAFILGDRLFPGALGLDELKQVIQQYRESRSDK